MHFYLVTCCSPPQLLAIGKKDDCIPVVFRCIHCSTKFVLHGLDHRCHLEEALNKISFNGEKKCSEADKRAAAACSHDARDRGIIVEETQDDPHADIQKHRKRSEGTTYLIVMMEKNDTCPIQDEQR